MKTIKFMLLAASLAATVVLSACTTGSPGGSVSLPSVSLAPVSIDPSAATEAIVTVLNEVDAAIASNQTPTGLTVEDRDALQQLATSIRTAVETGDFAAAQAAVDQLSAKVAEFAAKLDSDAGTTLNEAVAQLQALLAAS